MNLEELRKEIDAASWDVGSHPSIEDGKIRKSTGEYNKYYIAHGWNIHASVACDKEWSKFNIKLFQLIDTQKYDESYLEKVLDTIQTEDHHWDWFAKSTRYTAEQYHWFYIYAEGKPQGACMIYQPKPSVLHGSNIFYVEFIAVAPWNRDCLIRERDYKGIGSILLKAALRYATEELKLTPGFSLHSLPQARGYYEHLKMVNVESEEKDELLYFELPSLEACIFMGVDNDRS